MVVREWTRVRIIARKLPANLNSTLRNRREETRQQSQILATARASQSSITDRKKVACRNWFISETAGEPAGYCLPATRCSRFNVASLTVRIDVHASGGEEMKEACSNHALKIRHHSTAVEPLNHPTILRKSHHLPVVGILSSAL